MSLLLVIVLVLAFWGLKFLHQQESNPKMVHNLHSFGAQIPGFTSNKNQFYIYSQTFLSQNFQPL